MKFIVSKFIFFTILLLFLNSCLKKEIDLKKEVVEAHPVEYTLSEKAMERLKLPEPGVDIENAVPIYNYPNDNIFEIIIGLFTIEPQTEHYLTPVHFTAFPHDVWLQSIDWSIKDKEGNELPSYLLHHFNIINPNRREWFYPIPQRLFAAGSETTSVSLPFFMGMHVEGDHPLLLNTMFANHTDRLYSDISIHILVKYSNNKPLVNVYPFTLDAAGPIMPRDFEAPPGESITSDTAKAVVDGRIVGISGHLHNYGQYVKVMDASEDKTIWKATPNVAKDDTTKIISMPVDIFLFPWQKNIKKNHQIVTEAKYINPLSKPAPEKAMGTIGGIFVTSSHNEWYLPNYEDPQYMDDLTMTLSAPKVDHWHHMNPDEVIEKAKMK